MVEETVSKKSPDLQEVIDKFVELRDRLISKMDKGVEGIEEAESIYKEVIETAVDGLIKTEGHPDIMESLKAEFFNPVLQSIGPENTLVHNIFTSIATKIATETAQKLSHKE